MPPLHKSPKTRCSSWTPLAPGRKLVTHPITIHTQHAKPSIRGPLSRLRTSTLVLLKILKPSLHKVLFGPLRLLDRLRGEVGRSLVREHAVLVPVVHAVLDQDEGLADGALAVLEADGVRGGRAPGVLLAVDDGQPRIADVEAAVLVDGLDVRGLVDVEGLAAGDGGVVQVDGAGDQRELVPWNTGAGLEVTPSVNDMLV